MLTVLLSVIASLSFAEVGFKRGNQLDVQPVYGTAHIMCTEHGGTRPKQVACSADIVSPSLRDKFVTADSAGADKVELKSTFENGRSIVRTSKFDAAAGESKSSFNLWIKTLTQTPILRAGKNTIDYKLTKAGTEVRTGTFIAFVDVAREKRCRPAQLPFTYDCHEEIQVCNDYFYFNNNCEN